MKTIIKIAHRTTHVINQLSNSPINSLVSADRNLLLANQRNQSIQPLPVSSIRTMKVTGRKTARLVQPRHNRIRWPLTFETMRICPERRISSKIAARWSSSMTNWLMMMATMCSTNETDPHRRWGTFQLGTTNYSRGKWRRFRWMSLPAVARRQCFDCRCHAKNSVSARSAAIFSLAYRLARVPGYRHRHRPCGHRLSTSTVACRVSARSRQGLVTSSPPCADELRARRVSFSTIWVFSPSHCSEAMTSRRPWFQRVTTEL